MDSENVALVKRFYESLLREDPSPRISDDLLDPEVEWVNPEEAIEGGTRRGRGGWRSAVARLRDSFEQTEIVPRRFIEADDKVVALVDFRIRARGSGLETTQPQGHVWTIRDGKVARFEWFNQPRRALEAIGVEEG